MELMLTIKTTQKQDIEKAYSINIDRVQDTMQIADRLNTELSDLLQQETDIASINLIRQLTRKFNNHLALLTKKEKIFIQYRYIVKEDGDGGNDIYKVYQKNED